MHLQGKQRLILVAAAAVIVLVGLAVVSARASKSERTEPTPAAGSNINGQTTATKAEVDRLKSYGLVDSELPAGVLLRVGEELRNYAYAGGQGPAEIAAAEKGRIDGFYQVWLQTSAQEQFTATSSLYNSPASAMAVLSEPLQSDASGQIENLSSPKLGDFSRMYAFDTAQGAARYQGWRIQWVRGRTVFQVDGLGPPGTLHQDDIFNAAQHVDQRAEKAPIK